MSVFILVMANGGASGAGIRRLKTIAAFGTVFYWIGLCLVRLSGRNRQLLVNDLLMCSQMRHFIPENNLL